ncbi:NADPH-dependent FMN reductase [Kitasatospora sp. NPDC001664]
MTDKHFLALSGSLRHSSHNTGLLRALQALAPAGVTVELHPGLGALPFFGQDLEEGPAPAAVAELRRRVKAADGLLIATPEYNSAIPGVLVNALDWLSRPSEEHQTPVLRDKPTAILGASPSRFGTARGQLVLRQILHRTQSRVVAHPEVTVFESHRRFAADGSFLHDDFTDSLLRALLAELVLLTELTERHSHTS